MTYNIALEELVAIILNIPVSYIMHSAIEKCTANRKTVDCISFLCLLIQKKNKKKFVFKKGKSKVFKRIYDLNKNVRKNRQHLQTI